MLLTCHSTPAGPRWAADGVLLAPHTSLALLLGVPASQLAQLVTALTTGEAAPSTVLAPIDPHQEVWACGVTYLRSRDARMAESAVATLYDKAYEADRPEIFFKTAGWRVRADGAEIRIRKDSGWNVPEPELTLVVNAHGEIVGYTAGDDVSSRDIEGGNPLYLPQAKTYDGACALGRGIVLCQPEALRNVPIVMSITRGGKVVFSGESGTAQMKRSFDELVRWLRAELTFPNGVLVMTGTGIVPGEAFSLQPADVVQVKVGDLLLSNVVA